MNSKKLLCCLTGLCLRLFSLLAQARSELSQPQAETAFVEDSLHRPRRTLPPWS